MAAIHFDPYFNTDDLDYDSKAMCGTVYSEYYACGVSNWDDVTCKKCLKMKIKLQNEHEQIEKHIVKQMGDMSDFMKKLNTSDNKDCAVTPSASPKSSDDALAQSLNVVSN